ncbi:hypothetical protein PUN28_001382 [Cardiocondyla obscurior]|uniref:Uncharacterized protein n=1 Tax=Cardiocondyla obscurior TaxID=286306 RepID=A0AAW2H5D9_9HYME
MFLVRNWLRRKTKSKSPSDSSVESRRCDPSVCALKRSRNRAFHNATVNPVFTISNILMRHDAKSAYVRKVGAPVWNFIKPTVSRSKYIYKRASLMQWKSERKREREKISNRGDNVKKEGK